MRMIWPKSAKRCAVGDDLASRRERLEELRSEKEKSDRKANLARFVKASRKFYECNPYYYSIGTNEELDE